MAKGQLSQVCSALWAERGRLFCGLRRRSRIRDPLAEPAGTKIGNDKPSAAADPSCTTTFFLWLWHSATPSLTAIQWLCLPHRG